MKETKSINLAKPNLNMYIELDIIEKYINPN